MKPPKTLRKDFGEYADIRDLDEFDIYFTGNVKDAKALIKWLGKYIEWKTESKKK